MFAFLGKLVVRYWLAVLTVWMVAVVLGWAFAPAWHKVTRSGEVPFLPADIPSRRADALYANAFELQYSAANAALVFAREDGVLDAADRDFIAKEVVPGLGKLADEKSPISTIRTFAQEGVGALLVSPDKKATLVLVELKTAFQDPLNIPLVGKIEDLLAEMRQAGKVPDGLKVAITGSATAGRDLDLAEAASARTIERWTIAIVVALLLLLYRAPLIAVIPLATVFVAVEVSIHFLSAVAGWGLFHPSRDLRVFVTVLSYGAGVDYCLFLIARYREELDEGATPADALAHAIARVGGAITASAAVVIGGIGMLAFAKFGKIHQAGIVIPLALTIALAATLTFASALLRLSGGWAFWPQRIARAAAERPAGPPRPNVWDRIGPVLVRRAGTIFLATNLLLAPFVALGVLHARDQNYNPLTDLPLTAPSRAGDQLLRQHFPAGSLGPVTLLVQNDRVDFADPKSVPVIAALTNRLRDERTRLGIVDVRSLTEPLGISDVAKEKWASLGNRADLEADIRAQALAYYVSQAAPFAGHVMRLDVTLDFDPLNRGGIAALDQLEKNLPSLLPTELRDSYVYFAGPTSSLRDLSAIKQGDQTLIQILVSAIVFLLLLAVLRRVVISIYLVVSVLLSYLATLGLTDFVFRYFDGPEYAGLDWKVPIFLFTILVAVGEDYNIFLLTRVKEEQDEFGPLDAIPHALSRTGKVISSCGFVMAGTFASLLSGTIHAMAELGFALAVGVLLDTLVVRPILVPTFLVFLQEIVPGRVGRFMALGHWGK